VDTGENPDKPFVSASKSSAGPRPVFVARRAKSYAISVDTLGKLRRPNGDLGANHLICVVSEQVPETTCPCSGIRAISYIFSGKSSVHLTNAVNQLGEHFGIRILLLEGGGHINGAFLDAGLVDEVSLLVVPGIDGRHDIPAIFDGVSSSRETAVPLRLKSVEQRAHDALWIRYEVVRSEKLEKRNNAKSVN
jgi:2,5-diamino-6-(ribosylamino)-4(3H)-pyrimidinone 5'-phosphate reductase